MASARNAETYVDLWLMEFQEVQFSQLHVLRTNCLTVKITFVCVHMRV